MVLAMTSTFPLISADSHINEAPDLWETRLPARLRARGPRLVRKDDGRDVWETEGLAATPLMWATHAAAGQQESRSGDELSAPRTAEARAGRPVRLLRNGESSRVGLLRE